jgi:hypothetical protein
MFCGRKNVVLSAIVEEMKQNDITTDEVTKKYQSTDINIDKHYREKLRNFHCELWKTALKKNDLIASDYLYKNNTFYNQLVTKELINIKELVAFIKNADSASLVLDNGLFTQQPVPNKLNSIACCEIMAYDGFGFNLEKDFQFICDPKTFPFANKIANGYRYLKAHRESIGIGAMSTEQPAPHQYMNAAIYHYIRNCITKKTVAIHLSKMDDEDIKLLEYWFNMKLKDIPFDMEIIENIENVLIGNEQSLQEFMSERLLIQKIIQNIKKIYVKDNSKKRPVPI